MPKQPPDGPEADHPHDHSHADGHGHDHAHVPEEPALRVKALETLLVDKGLVDPAALDELIRLYTDEIGPKNGARVVARAWTDPEFLSALREDATEAIARLGYTGRQGEHMVAVENTPDVHNLVVCTLCSCYPWSVLGIPPRWYKSEAYRARAVREPRAVLAEFGVQIDDDVSVRVWDSTAEVRYLVIPERPPGTDHLDEAALSDLVTRDAMIGTERQLTVDGGDRRA
ncbi:MAG: nitrile hydratase subunit alpha [Pseudomonadota bacterium]